MTSVDDVWAQMECALEFGGARRISADYTFDAFCVLGGDKRRGLLLIVDDAPLQVPLFDAMEITVSVRTDNRIAIAITLISTSLTEAFVGLCDGLLAVCEVAEQQDLGRTIVSYLVHANSLLEYRDPQILGATALRGLIGELIVLGELFDLFSLNQAITAWQGPLRAPQDFVFAKQLIETKTKTQVGNSITISSLDQLDPIAPLPLTLAVVTISSLQEDLPDGVSPSSLVAGTRQRLVSDPIALEEFGRRLRAANYFAKEYYARMKFRLISIRYYRVLAEFPRIRRVNLPPGVLSASYEVDLSACDAYETILGDTWI